MVVSDLTQQQRIDKLARLLRHPDPSQLLFQVAEIAGEQCYLRHGIEVRPGDVVLDVGANVGVAAVFFAELCGAGVVHSFEPVAPIRRLLRENVAGIEACVVHDHGLSSAAGRAAITYYPGADAMSGLYADPNRDCAFVGSVRLRNDPAAEPTPEDSYETQTLWCELQTLSWFLSTAGIDHVDLVKIDVERAELDVLDGIDDADWSKIRQLVIEVHDEDGRATVISQRLREHGYAVIDDQEPAMRGTSVRMLYSRRS